MAENKQEEETLSSIRETVRVHEMVTPPDPRHTYSIDPQVMYTNEYSTCCSRTGKTDARLIRFASRFTMSILSMGFAAIQIYRAKECDGLLPFYCSMITFVLGAWVSTDAEKRIDTPIID